MIFTRQREKQALVETMEEVKESAGMIIAEDEKDIMTVEEKIIPVRQIQELILWYIPGQIS